MWIMMMTAVAMAAMPAPGATAALRTALEQAAEGPVRLDPRIRIPACAAGWAISVRPTALVARCPGQGWSIVVPTATAEQSGGPLVRRGATVVVESAGSGFSARVDGVAEQDAAAGEHVRVRNMRSGTRLVALVQADGRLIANSR